MATKLKSERGASPSLSPSSQGDELHIEVATLQNGGKQWMLRNAKKEGWEPGDTDLDMFSFHDPSGFFVGFLGDKIVGSVSGTVLDQELGFIGYYIVDPELRGRGYGRRLFQHAMNYLGDRNVGLDGLLTQVPNYERSGFVVHHSNARYQGIRSDGAAACSVDSGSSDCDIVSLNYISLEQILTYDSKYFPSRRQLWIDSLLHTPGAVSAGFVQHQRGSGSGVGVDVLCGFGVMRPCVSGYRLAPLYAETAEIAKELLTWLRAQLPVGAVFFIDVPCINAEGVSLVEDEGMTRVGESCRMYTKGMPQAICWGGVFGLSSLELG